MGATLLETKSDRLKIPYTITPDVGGIAEVRAFHNGKLVMSDGTYKDAIGNASTTALAANAAATATPTLGPDGKPRSIFTPLPDGTPRIVAHLLARHAEVAGAAPELRGMPLGLTPVPLPDIALLATWISQGRKP